MVCFEYFWDFKKINFLINFFLLRLSVLEYYFLYYFIMDNNFFFRFIVFVILEMVDYLLSFFLNIQVYVNIDNSESLEDVDYSVIYFN